MASLTRQKFTFTIPKAKVQADFMLPEAPIDWAAEGQGREGWLITRRPDASQTNNPVAGVTRIIARYVLIPFEDVYTRYFTSIPPFRFAHAFLRFTASDVIVDLAQEE